MKAYTTTTGPLGTEKEYKAEPVGMFMPTTFLENHEVTDQIVKLVQNTKEELIIITPSKRTI